jgi:hypothetical protein
MDLDKCLDIIARFDEFSIHHIYRYENSKANDLVQQASGYNVSNRNFSITRKLMRIHVQNQSLSVPGVEIGLTGSPIGLTGVPGAQSGLTDTPTSLISPTIPNNPVLENSASSNLKHDKTNY